MRLAVVRNNKIEKKNCSGVDIEHGLIALSNWCLSDRPAIYYQGMAFPLD